MNSRLVGDIMGALASEKFQSKEIVLPFLDRLFGNLGSSVLSEHCFQRGRHAEHETQQRRLTALRSWSTSTRSGVLQRNGFAEVRLDDVTPDNTRQSFPEAFFRGSRKEATLKEVDRIPGRCKTSWASVQPQGEAKMVEDMQCLGLLEHQLLRAQSCWRSQLVVPGMMVASGKWGKSKCFFSMGCQGWGLCLWPAERHDYGTIKTWRPRPIQNKFDLKWVAV